MNPLNIDTKFEQRDLFWLGPTVSNGQVSTAHLFVYFDSSYANRT